MGLWRDIREDISCVFERDPAARSTLEIMATYPGVHALIWHRIAHRLWKRGHRFLARFLSWVGRLLTNVDIHPGATIGKKFFIDHGAGVVIGETAEIGDGVTLYHGVTLGGTTWNKGKRHPTLEDNVVVGAGAKVLGAIRIGCNSKVGANSVVVENVPSGATVVGVPGRVVRKSKKVAYFNPHGIDLNHHLIPDPVAEAISCLVKRIDELEGQLGKKAGDDTCDDCTAHDVCEPPVREASHG
ncbi:serine O-acetyltransferase [Rhodobium gokarnense]|uniref:Serine O-acetyltransferase n=1 Tax=Rhodobium gokarnense TaxID=364296 RepID=A0ABT3H951_9HYPH|nr:serine O-acetyltransferase [Rhodobium gokarnense]MCW2306869.1 serine O-acetyltransferase [Rhodobium gokarnense]